MSRIFFWMRGPETCRFGHQQLNNARFLSVENRAGALAGCEANRAGSDYIRQSVTVQISGDRIVFRMVVRAEDVLALWHWLNGRAPCR
jgi:hypothetical protein